MSIAATIALAPTPAYASDESQLLALTNQVRAANGVGALTIDSQLSAVAERWAATLAERGVISHNASLPNQVTGWKLLGENVGVGGTVEAIHQGFVGSPTHFENLVEPAFTKVGFGIVRPDARVFVVEVFMQPQAATAPAPAVVPESRVIAASSAPATTVAAAPPTTSAAATATAAAATGPAEVVLDLGRLRSMQPW